MTQNKQAPTEDWIDFQVKVAATYYRDGFEDGLRKLPQSETAISYVQGYKDAQKIYKGYI